MIRVSDDGRIGDVVEGNYGNNSPAHNIVHYTQGKDLTNRLSYYYTLDAFIH